MSTLSRRRLLALGGAALSGGVLSAAGFAGERHRAGRAAAGSEVLLLDEADPTATPVIVSATPTATATASPTATPTPTPVVRRPAWNSDLLRQVLRSGPTDRPMVALTVDDGWSDRDAVLNVLKERRAKLTFFLAGRCVAGDRGFVARALDAGFEVANHTMDHYDLTNKTASYIQKDLSDFEDLVRAQVTGATTLPYMRPSGGALNQTVIDASAAAGYRPVLWSGSSGDGGASTTPDQMVQNVLTSARPGAILLMHFGPRAVVALPAMIDGLRAKGLEPVTLSRLFEAPG
jgi:peptidoglycan/xylan/chitin deacetylase (PgdA/CDA1 family)